MTRRILLAVACVCTVVFTTAAPQAQALDPIRYTLRFPAPHTHYVEVEAAIPTSGRAEVEVYMATWTPGSYLIREYERNVEAVTAAAGTRALAVVEVDQEPLEDHDRRRAERHAALQGLQPRDDGPQQLGRSRLRDAERRADLHHARRARRASARSARRAAGGLEEGRDARSSRSADRANTFRAPDFDTIVDSPIIIGNPVTREFTVDGKRHVVRVRRRYRADRRRQGRGRRAEDRRAPRRT